MVVSLCAYDVLEDPQVQHNGDIVQTQLTTGETVTLLAHATTYDGERPGVHLAPQPLGAQTREILQELGTVPVTLRIFQKQRS